MNRRNLIFKLFLASTVAAANAQQPGISEADLLEIGILPNSIPVLDNTAPEADGRPISSDENNPFSERVKDTPQVVVQTENEELKI